MNLVEQVVSRTTHIPHRLLEGTTAPVGVIYTRPDGHELSVMLTDPTAPWGGGLAFGHYDVDDELVGDDEQRLVLGELLPGDRMLTTEDVVRKVAGLVVENSR